MNVLPLVYIVCIVVDTLYTLYKKVKFRIWIYINLRELGILEGFESSNITLTEDDLL